MPNSPSRPNASKADAQGANRALGAQVEVDTPNVPKVSADAGHRDSVDVLPPGSPGAFWTVGRDGEITSTNIEFVEVIDRSVEERVDRPIPELTEIDRSNKVVVEHLNPTRDDPFKGRFQRSHRLPDGTLTALDFSAFSTEDTDAFAVLIRAARAADAVQSGGRRSASTKLARVLASTTDGYWSVAPDGCIQEINATHASVLGYTPEEMIGTHISNYSRPNPTDEAVRVTMEQIKQLGTARFESEHVHRLGHLVAVESVAAYLPEHDETIAFIRDISARKHAEAELRTQKRALSAATKKLTKMLESVVEGVMTLDATGRVTNVNAAVCRLLGMKREQLVGELTGVVRNGQDEVLKVVRRLLSEGGQLTVEREFAHPDGRTLTFEVIATALIELDEVMVLLYDVTERQQAVRKEQAAREAFERQAGRFTALTQATLDGFWSAGPDGIVREVNDALCTMLGWSREEIVGQHLSCLTPADAREDAERWRTRLLRLRHVRTDSVLGRRDGSKVPVALTAWVDPQDGAYLCLAHDVTALHVMQEQKQALLGQREAQAKKFEALTNASLDGFIMVDRDSVILEVNDEYLKLGGWSRHALRGAPIAVVMASTEEFLRETNTAMLETPQVRFETQHRRADGTLFPVDVSAVAMQSTGHCLLFVRDTTERKAHEESSRHAAHYDMLTDLPNRRMLIDSYRKTSALTARRQEHGALVYLDLDNFKFLNDARGHDVGDEVLREVAKRLRMCVRDCDTVARVGGDEFALVLGELSGDVHVAAGQASVVAERVCRSLAKPYVMKDYVHTGGCSVGVALFRDEQDELDSVMKYADSAMYLAKKSGRNQVRFFDTAMQARLTARSGQARELSDALAREQFLLHYQVQVGADHRPCGAEALVRWLHPDRGLLAPCEFIPLAEETGFILLLDDWVLHTACVQLRAWQDHDDTKDLPLSVNVSAKAFNQADFEQRVLHALQATGAPPHLLKLELTETIALKNVEQTVTKMTSLQKHGVKFSMDDFGTGYASLTNLRQLPFDQLKIDQAFVRGLPHEPMNVAIVESILAMSRGLGIEVVAEGIETADELDALRSRGCIKYQGYLFSRPIHHKDYESLLHQS